MIIAHVPSLGSQARPSSRPPTLTLEDDGHGGGAAGGEAGTLAARWAARAKMLDEAVAAHVRNVMRMRGAAAASTPARNGARAAGRRLRSEPTLWMLNCSRVWRGGAG